MCKPPSKFPETWVCGWFIVPGALRWVKKDQASRVDSWLVRQESLFTLSGRSRLGAGRMKRTSSASHPYSIGHRCAWRAEAKLGPGTKVPPTNNTVWGPPPPVWGCSLLYVVVLGTAWSLSYAGLSVFSLLIWWVWLGVDDCFSWACSLLL